MQLKNFCPYSIGDIYITTTSENPATKYLGTTWEKIESKFLLGSSSTYPLNTTGGNSSVKLSKANLPAEKLQLDSFSISRGTMEITGSLTTQYSIAGSFDYRGAFSSAQSQGVSGNSFTGATKASFKFDASKSWTGSSTSTSPYTTNMGNGTSFNIIPPYISVNIWKRTS